MRNRKIGKLEGWKIGRLEDWKIPSFRYSVPLLFLLFFLPKFSFSQEIPTYYDHIQPILQKNCLACHHTGGAGPFSLETYESVERRADFIQTVTESRYMPPWFADPNFNHFRNEKRLTDTEIKTIAAWVQGGKKRGKAPKKLVSHQKIEYLQPDMVIPMNKPFVIPGDRTEQFRLFVMPTNIEEELYVQGIDVRPGNLQLAHHARLMIDTTHLFRADDGASVSDTVMQRTNWGVQMVNYFWHGWVPGNFLTLYPPGIGKRLPKDSDIVMNMHYSPSSKPDTDQSQVLLYVTKEKPRRLIETFILDESWVVNKPFRIPANQVVKFYVRSPLVPADISLINVLPHMHFLGKSFKAYAITPQGQVINIIKIDDWNFNWQMTYQFEHLIKLPKNSVVYAEAVYDNTSNNGRNPHFPPQDATLGWGTTNEMMNLIFEYLDFEPGDETLDLYQQPKK